MKNIFIFILLSLSINRSFAEASDSFVEVKWTILPGAQIFTYTLTGREITVKTNHFKRPIRNLIISLTPRGVLWRRMKKREADTTREYRPMKFRAIYRRVLSENEVDSIARYIKSSSILLLDDSYSQAVFDGNHYLVRISIDGSEKSIHLDNNYLAETNHLFDLINNLIKKKKVIKLEYESPSK